MTQTADLYLRLSLDRDGSTSIERQDRDCTEWCERNGLTIRKRHIDRGRSGYRATVERKGFDEAIKAVTKGQVSTLVVWKLDRLSRRGIGQVGMVLDAVERAGSRIVFVQDGLDTSNSNSRSVIAFLAERARSESADISLRVKSAKAYLRTKGKWLGGVPPYGLRLNENGELEHDPVEAPIVRRMVEEYLNGKSLVAIARGLNEDGYRTRKGALFGLRSVAAPLHSPVLAGMLPETVTREDPETGEKIYTGVVKPWRNPETGDTVQVCDPLITPAERSKIEQIAASRRSPHLHGYRPVRKGTALLTGLAFCAACGARMSRTGNSYVCSKAKTRTGRGCRGARALVKNLDDYVSQQWRERLERATANPEDPFLHAVADRWLRLQNPKEVSEREELRARLEDLSAKLGELEEARYIRGEFHVPGGPERYERLRARLSEQIAQVQDRLEEMGKGSVDLGGLLESDVVLEAWEAADVEMRRSLLRLAFDRVEVTLAKGRGYRWNPQERVRLVEVSPQDNAA